MSEKWTPELETALHAVAVAAEVCVRVRAGMAAEDTLSKSDKSPVTVADFGSQAVVCRILRESFPSDRIVAEESSRALLNPGNEAVLQHVTRVVGEVWGDLTEDEVRRWIDVGKREIADRYWCLDPIDGTKGFLRGDQYAVALALVEGGKVRLGVLGCPNLPHNLARPEGPRGVLFLAVAGEGAYQTGLAGGNGVPVRVSPEGLGGNLRFCESFEAGHADHESHMRVAERLGIKAPSIRMDSQAKYGVLARGDACLYLRIPNPRTPDYREKAWDHAAGTILIEEAGGRVTDIAGRPLDFGVAYQLLENRGVVATNGLIHDEVLAALRS